MPASRLNGLGYHGSMSGIRTRLRGAFSATLAVLAGQPGIATVSTHAAHPAVAVRPAADTVDRGGGCGRCHRRCRGRRLLERLPARTTRGRLLERLPARTTVTTGHRARLVHLNNVNVEFEGCVSLCQDGQTKLSLCPLARAFRHRFLKTNDIIQTSFKEP